jgi:hypothetical protein
LVKVRAVLVAFTKDQSEVVGDRAALMLAYKMVEPMVEVEVDRLQVQVIQVVALLEQ